METITPVKALNEFFNVGDAKKPLPEFAKEIKALSESEKRELAEGAAAALGKTLKV